MTGSILTETKAALSLDDSYTVFDIEIQMYINSAFATLNQLGLGPDGGFEISDKTATWDAFLGDDKRLNPVKTYVYLRTRLLFDPPTTSYLIDALDKQRLELEWRLNVVREEDTWVEPTPPTSPWC